MSEIEKIKYHLSLLAESLDHRAHPIPSLVISLNWDQAELDAAHDIFQEFNDLIENDGGIKEEINWVGFEGLFKERLGIGYQSLKSVVLAFYRNHQWTEVCQLYASAYPSSEFSEINRTANESFEQEVGRALGQRGMAFKRNAVLTTGKNVGTEVDFLLSIFGKIIAIEVKTSITGVSAHQLVSISNSLVGGKSVDRFIVVSQKLTNVAKDILASNNIEILTLEELKSEII
jgi:hypothetical protein